MRRHHSLAALVWCWMAWLVTPASAGELRVAVASNFAPLMTVLADQFERDYAHSLILIPGSTGKHYAQIKNGAPFDVFFAADTERPQLLEEQGYAVAASRFTYALGQLAVWSRQPGLAVRNELLAGRFRYLAIANPDLAPYGRAARQVLAELQLINPHSHKLVRGENVAQAFQFVASGNAELGLLAWSQVKAFGQGSHWLVPAEYYQPIEQQAVIIRPSEAAQSLFKFMRSDPVRKAIQGYGYATR